MAAITAAPPGYIPFDAYPPISAADALPYWTVREDSTVCTAVWGAPVALDETSVTLINGNYQASLQDVYSIQLYAYADAPPGYFHSASISQTGVVPAGSHSIQFLMESPPVAGGVVPSQDPEVSLRWLAISVALLARQPSSPLIVRASAGVPSTWWKISLNWMPSAFRRTACPNQTRVRLYFWDASALS